MSAKEEKQEERERERKKRRKGGERKAKNEEEKKEKKKENKRKIKKKCLSVSMPQCLNAPHSGSQTKFLRCQSPFESFVVSRESYNI